MTESIRAEPCSNVALAVKHAPDVDLRIVLDIVYEILKALDRP